MVSWFKIVTTLKILKVFHLINLIRILLMFLNSPYNFIGILKVRVNITYKSNFIRSATKCFFKRSSTVLIWQIWNFAPYALIWKLLKLLNSPSHLIRVIQVRVKINIDCKSNFIKALQPQSAFKLTYDIWPEIASLLTHQGQCYKTIAAFFRGKLLQ
jgi:hypothetical protein